MIVFPDIASVYVIDVLVYNVTSSGVLIKFYFDIQNACYTKMAYLVLGSEDMGKFGLERCSTIHSLREGSYRS
jgi:hypothetical protein